MVFLDNIAILDIASLLDVFLFLLIVIIPKPREIQNRKNLDTQTVGRVCE